MSAGRFSDSRYTSNTGRVYAIRVQPETLSATIDSVANSATVDAITEEVSAKVSGGKRSIGLSARTVSLRFTGAIPDGYSGDDVVIPVLQQTTFDSWTAAQGKTGTYLALPVKVVGSSSERRR